uniref:Uncharacterized protein n=1 Tax=Micrurus lemniscatus lemniscatus TaxID=129467 RepID=A0A2D4HR98_MICLE
MMLLPFLKMRPFHVEERNLLAGSFSPNCVRLNFCSNNRIDTVILEVCFYFIFFHLKLKVTFEMLCAEEYISDMHFNSSLQLAFSFSYSYYARNKMSTGNL